MISSKNQMKYIFELPIFIKEIFIFHIYDCHEI